MAETMLRPGMIGWNELMTTDVKAAKRFYIQLFGWTTEDNPMPGMTYSVIKNGEAGIGHDDSPAGSYRDAALVGSLCDRQRCRCDSTAMRPLWTIHGNLFIAAGATSTGGVTALVVQKLHAKTGAKLRKE